MIHSIRCGWGNKESSAKINFVNDPANRITWGESISILRAGISSLRNSSNSDLTILEACALDTDSVIIAFWSSGSRAGSCGRRASRQSRWTLSSSEPPCRSWIFRYSRTSWISAVRVQQGTLDKKGNLTGHSRCTKLRPDTINKQEPPPWVSWL